MLLEREKLRECSAQAELIHAARVNASEEWFDNVIDHFVSEPPAQKGAERNVGVDLRLRQDEVEERAQLARPRHEAS